ncbi:MAG: RNA-binding domain-containing protein [Dongiaceae bacterium]
MIPPKHPSQFTIEDINRLIADAEPESDRLEFKRALPVRSSGDKEFSAKPNSAEYSNYTRDSILRELVAFANTNGGYLIIGISENAGPPPRAAALTPIPDCEAVVSKLHQQVIDCVDPPLPDFAAAAIPTDNEHRGIVILSVGRSRRGPHQLKTLPGGFFRRVGSISCAMTVSDAQAMAVRRHRESIEGLWTADFRTTNSRNGGIVVFDGGWLYGGDSCFFYAGQYAVQEDVINAEFNIIHYFGNDDTAFGDKAKVAPVTFTGIIAPDLSRISGTMQRLHVSAPRLDVNLLKRVNPPY